MVDVPVIKPFTHEGRAFSIGDTISVSPVVATVLHRQGKVSLTRGYRTRSVVADVPAESQPQAPLPRRRRTYRRRDLTAEPA